MLNAFPGNMRIRVTRTQQNWRATQIAAERYRFVQGTDQAASEGQETCIALGMTCHDFSREACSLREPTKRDLGRRKAGASCERQRSSYLVEG